MTETKQIIVDALREAGILISEEELFETHLEFWKGTTGAAIPASG